MAIYQFAMHCLIALNWLQQIRLIGNDALCDVCAALHQRAATFKIVSITLHMELSILV